MAKEQDDDVLLPPVRDALRGLPKNDGKNDPLGNPFIRAIIKNNW